MSAFPADGVDCLLDGNWLRIACHFRPEFLVSRGADPLLGGLLEANDSSRNVPAGSVGLVLPPREEGAVALVPNQEIYVDQRCEAAEEEEKLLRQPVGRLSHPGVQRRKRLLISLFHDSSTMLQDSAARRSI